MATVKELYKKTKRINLIKLVVQVLDLPEVQDFIADKNKDQLNSGLTIEGEKITPDYVSDDYAKAKQDMNSKPGLFTPDLFLSGDFYEGLTADLAGQNIEIFSTDWKSDDLEKKYGDIFGLTKSNMEQLKREFILPELLNLIHNELQL
jgi:hypothetical protein